MKNRLLATLLTLALLLGMTCGALAEETTTFDTVAATEVSFLKTVDDAMKPSQHKYVAATLYLEYVLYQDRNDMPLENRALWNDCVIGCTSDWILLGYDLEGETLLLLYDPALGEISTMINPAEFTTSNMKEAMRNSGVTSLAVVDGDDWTDVLAAVLTAMVED